MLRSLYQLVEIGNRGVIVYDAIMRSTPDLEYYAKIARENRRKKKS